MSITRYYRPRRLEDALCILDGEPSARCIAGGTDLMTRIRRRVESPETLVSLRGVPELTGIALDDGRLSIGAATPLAEIASHRSIREGFPVLAEAIASMASIQIRNVATIGGNLANASPCADTAPPLLAADATVRLRSAHGERELPLSDFFIGPGKTKRVSNAELLTEIVVPSTARSARAIFLKKGRVAGDIALASLAVLLDLEGQNCRIARVAAGAVAPVPLRLEAVEELLAGAVLTTEVVAQAQELARRSIRPISDLRASARYRELLVGAFLGRAIDHILCRRTT